MIVMFDIPNEIVEKICDRTPFYPELFIRAMHGTCIVSLADEYKEVFPELYEYLNSREIKEEINDMMDEMNRIRRGQESDD